MTDMLQNKIKDLTLYIIDTIKAANTDEYFIINLEHFESEKLKIFDEFVLFIVKNNPSKNVIFQLANEIDVMNLHLKILMDNIEF